MFLLHNALRQQQGNAVATAAAALQARHKKIAFSVFARVRVYLQRYVVRLRTTALMCVSPRWVLMCDFASVSQPPSLLQPRQQRYLLRGGRLASSIR